ncbi:MAG: hypothetical protein QXT63_03730 [Thermoplasmata archaeon]
MLDPRTGREIKRSSYSIKGIIRDICGPDVEIVDKSSKYSKVSKNNDLMQNNKKDDAEEKDVIGIANNKDTSINEKEDVHETMQDVSVEEENKNSEAEERETHHVKTHHNTRKEQKKLTHALLKILANIDKLDDEAFVLFYVGMSREFERRFDLENYSQKIIAIATNALKEEE